MFTPNVSTNKAHVTLFCFNIARFHLLENVQTFPPLVGTEGPGRCCRSGQLWRSTQRIVAAREKLCLGSKVSTDYGAYPLTSVMVGDLIHCFCLHPPVPLVLGSSSPAPLRFLWTSAVRRRCAAASKTLIKVSEDDEEAKKSDGRRKLAVK